MDYIYEYQNGSKKASLFLINENADFIGEFYDLFVEQTFTYTENVLGFLELLGKESKEKSYYLLKSLIKEYNAEDLYNLLVNVLLALAKRHDFTRDFEPYIKVCFKYELYNRLIENNFDYFENYCAPDFDIIFDDDSIESFKTESHLSSLTVLQRIILKLMFIEDLTSYSISEMLHIDPEDCENEIQEGLKKIIE